MVSATHSPYEEASMTYSLKRNSTIIVEMYLLQVVTGVMKILRTILKPN
ncbi:MAG: hypothetical protein HC906_12125 [Bacteroidales bacterium]|nr:hypothetical protein [Bacteroidales bacterium]